MLSDIKIMNSGNMENMLIVYSTFSFDLHHQICCVTQDYTIIKFFDTLLVLIVVYPKDYIRSSAVLNIALVQGVISVLLHRNLPTV